MFEQMAFVSNIIAYKENFKSSYILLSDILNIVWCKCGVCVEMTNPQAIDIQLLADLSWWSGRDSNPWPTA